MPDMNGVNSLYPQPPAAPAPAMTPFQALDAVSRFRLLQEFQSRQAIGEEAQKSIHGGTFDPSEFRTRVGNRPDAALAAPQAITQSLSNDRQNIDNATALFDQWARQSDYTQTQLQGLANLPKPTADDVRSWAVGVSRDAHPGALPSSVINAQVALILKDPRGIKAGLTSLQNRLRGAGGAAAQIPGPPGPSGEPTSIPAGAAAYGGTMPIGQAPGEAEAQVASAGRGANLMATASTSPQYHADLENLRHESRVLGNIGGPTAETEKKINQLASRFGIEGNWSKEQLAAGESFDKIANQISLNQSKLFHGSDAGLNTVLGSNPSLNMSRFGRDGVIDMLQGNQDAIDVTRKMWADARAKGAPMHAHDTFINEAAKVIDPRVFQFNRLSRQNQQQYWSQMDPSDIPEFKRKYMDALQRGWVKPLKAGN
jgi:hypothetical protein